MSGVRAKITRAEEHFHLLEREIEAFFQPQSHHIVHQFDPQTNEHRWILESEVPPIPYRIPTIAGDILYNLRSALDHLAWQLVLTNRGTPDNRTAFPIFHDPKQYQKEGNSKLRGMSQEATTLIDKAQPCNGGNQSLQALEILTNIDKHRHLSVTVVNLGKIRLEATPFAIPAKSSVAIYMHTGPVNRGTVLTRITHPQVDMHFDHTFGIAFGEGTIAEGKDIKFTLTLINNAVLEVVGNLRKHVH